MAGKVVDVVVDHKLSVAKTKRLTKEEFVGRLNAESFTKKAEECAESIAHSVLEVEKTVKKVIDTYTSTKDGVEEMSEEEKKEFVLHALKIAYDKVDKELKFDDTVDFAFKGLVVDLGVKRLLEKSKPTA